MVSMPPGKFVKVLEFFYQFQVPEKSWNIILVLKSSGNNVMWCRKALE